MTTMYITKQIFNIDCVLFSANKWKSYIRRPMSSIRSFVGCATMRICRCSYDQSPSTRNVACRQRVVASVVMYTRCRRRKLTFSIENHARFCLRSTLLHSDRQGALRCHLPSITQPSHSQQALVFVVILAYSRRPSRGPPVTSVAVCRLSSVSFRLSFVFCRHVRQTQC